jgi:hypothetical protein
MGGLYLTDLADVVRRAGLSVIEVGSGPSQTGTAWKTRARGSGGYSSGRPNAVMVHHTASGASADGWGDANYCTFSDSDRPLCNLYLSRKGQVWVCAAGATNTNGSGGPLGPVPKDSMNSCAIGIEAGNNGTGEPWPDAQQDAYVKLASALCSAYGIPTSQVYSHAEWAPSRKVDPAGPSQWSKSSGGGSSNMWNMGAFRASCGGAAPGPGPGPGPATEGEGAPEMAVAIQASDGTPEQQAMIFAWQPGCSIGWLTSDAQINVGLITGALAFDSSSKPLRNFGAAEIQDFINRYWAGGPKPPGWQ